MEKAMLEGLDVRVKAEPSHLNFCLKGEPTCSNVCDKGEPTCSNMRVNDEPSCLIVCVKDEPSCSDVVKDEPSFSDDEAASGVVKEKVVLEPELEQPHVVPTAKGQTQQKGPNGVLKSYQCDDCSYTTHRNFDLLKHQRKHTVAIMNAVDTERVICEVRERPELWDLSHSLYKDRDARQSAWTQICEILYPGFMHMENTKKKEIEKIVQQRWKTARDAYMRCKNSLKNTPSGSGATSKKKIYVYFDDIKFLDKRHDIEEDSMNTDAIERNSIEPSNQDISSLEFQVNSPVSETGDSPQQTTEPTRNIYKKTKILRKRKHSENNDFDKEIITKLLKNEDLSFFISLLPLMEQFSMHQKLIFHSEVLKKAMEIGSFVNPYETKRSDFSH